MVPGELCLGGKVLTPLTSYRFNILWNKCLFVLNNFRKISDLFYFDQYSNWDLNCNCNFFVDETPGLYFSLRIIKQESFVSRTITNLSCFNISSIRYNDAVACCLGSVFLLNQFLQLNRLFFTGTDWFNSHFKILVVLLDITQYFQV